MMGRSGCSTRARGSCGGLISNTFRHEVVCSLPGYLRGLGFLGPVALVGLCTIREKHIFGGLPVQERHPRLRCGVAVIEVSTGRQLGLFEFTEGCTELFDVRFLPDVRRPMILNAEKEANAAGRHRPGVFLLASTQRRRAATQVG